MSHFFNFFKISIKSCPKAPLTKMIIDSEGICSSCFFPKPSTVFFQNLCCSIVSSRLSVPVSSWVLLSDFQGKRFSALAPCAYILSNGLCSELLHWNRLSLPVHWTQYCSPLQVTSIKVTHTHTHLKLVTCAIITCHSKLKIKIH